MTVQAPTPNDAVDGAGEMRRRSLYNSTANCNSSSKDFNCLVIARVLRTRILLMSVDRLALSLTGGFESGVSDSEPAFRITAKRRPTRSGHRH